jgi:hypothetical protein
MLKRIILKKTKKILHKNSIPRKKEIKEKLKTVNADIGDIIRIIESLMATNIAGEISERTRTDTYLEIPTQMKEGEN